MGYPRPADPEGVASEETGEVQCRDRLGGLLESYYYRQAA